ncbi:hypothetical protein FA13DRAFT_1792664 [Coprinellus micaceus]|uniref:HMG box domain-containing protein n=1 Tax=Coprinellus micaceus TaxID=71717 RepID=A0A4Y7T7T0_COPMI|nr:hypothetical protein FA13DRAFT_1792664 [Coprinellus micaceus]
MSQSPAYPLSLSPSDSELYEKPHIMYIPNYCPVPLAKHLRESQSVSPLVPPTMPLPATPPSSSLSQVPLPPPQNHIRRPPNAFMIYRSELIKSRAIPPMVEHRQQNISKLAGECWNLLSQAEKDVYHEKARQALAKHNLDHPGYKFQPAPRGSKGPKAKAQSDSATNAERIKQIREKYCGIVGPSTVAQRKRKSKSKEHRVSEGKTSKVQQQVPSPRPSPLSPALEINPGLSFSGPPTPESHGPATPMTSVAGGSNQGNFHIIHPMPSFVPPPTSTLSEALLPRRPSTTAFEKLPSQRSSSFNFNYFSTTLFTTRPLPSTNFFPTFELNAGPAPSIEAPQADYSSIPDQAMYGSFPGYADFNTFGPNAGDGPELLDMAGFNQQQQQAVEEASIGGSHGVAPLGLHIRSLSDSVCPLDTTGIQHGAHAASAFDWGLGATSYDHALEDDFGCMSVADGSTSSAPSPTYSSGSSSW